ncbi:MAG: hypothetical protein RQ728_09970 [Brevefilum sp.]|nr:hypothetical protein [Brevefilum sp.]MDT8382562.1 hypothetical protein [Brevefilum sp.]MDW7755698.1 hypothetical protein [Brevefilum sp.]
MINRMKSFCLFGMVIFCLSLVGCGLFSNVKPDAGRSPTATSTMASGVLVTDIPEKHPCDGLSGTLELQILVGPSEIVGLEPTSVGEIPFEVISDGEIFTITGFGPMDYYVETESYEWGTYTVTFEGDAVVSGDCMSRENGGDLNVNIELIGEQNLEVNVEGTTSNYPWSGVPQMTVNFPIEDGAMREGEGWVLILHLK